MNTYRTRLDDKLNAVMVGATLALALGLGLNVSAGASFGRDDCAVELAHAKAAATTVAQEVFDAPVLTVASR